MFKIGKVEIKGRIICAPMAGVSNKAFRKLVKKNGAALTYTEMISNVGLKYNSDKTLDYADIDKEEAPVALQIFGGDVSDYVEGAKYFDKHSNASIIDINMGCPVQKVAIKSNAGSALIKTPEKIREIVRAIIKEIDKPLTIKIRIGWDKDDLTYLQVAKIAEEEGVAAIAVHGRTRSQMYTGKADWNAIKEIKDSISIPVIGNGDVTSPEEAKKMLDETGVDAVMIARAAQNDPFIFKQINEYLEKGSYSQRIILGDMCDEIKNFYYDLINVKGEITAFKEIKGFAASWLTNYAGIKSLKNDLVRSQNLEEFFEKLNEIKKFKK